MSVSHPFWIVWSPEGKSPPTRKYASKAQAVSVAKDMTTKHPGQHFFALETVAGFVSKVQLDELLVQPLSPPPELFKARQDYTPYKVKYPVPHGYPASSAATGMEPTGLEVGSEYKSQRGTSRVVELRNVDGRIAIVVYRAEDRPLHWRESKWSSHLGQWWTPDKLRQGDPLHAYGRTPQPFSLPALYVL